MFRKPSRAAANLRYLQALNLIFAKPLLLPRYQTTGGLLWSVDAGFPSMVYSLLSGPKTPFDF